MRSATRITEILKRYPRLYSLAQCIVSDRSLRSGEAIVFLRCLELVLHSGTSQVKRPKVSDGGRNCGMVVLVTKKLASLIYKYGIMGKTYRHGFNVSHGDVSFFCGRRM